MYRHRLFILCLVLLAPLALAAAPRAVAAQPDRTEVRGYGYLSGRVFSHFLTMPIERQMPIHENILGAWSEGVETTRATLTVRTVPDTRWGAFELRLAGQSGCPESVSRKGPATVISSAYTDFDARVRLVLADDAFRIASIDAESSTSAEIFDVQTRNPVIEPLARRRANKKLPEVEQEVSRLKEEKISEHLRQEVTGLALQANDAIGNKAKRPLAKANAWPKFTFSTDPSGLSFQALPAGPARAIEKPAPQDWKANADLALCVHESLLEQMVDGLLGGKEVTDEQVLSAIRLLTGGAPRPLWVHERAERWSVVLDRSHPVGLTFRDGVMKVVVSIDEAVRDKKRLPAPARVTATFEARPFEDGLVLRRRGDLTVELMNPPADKAEAESLQAFLASKFGAIFAPEVYFDGLAPPSGGFGLKMREVRPDSFDFQDGWALVAYVLRPGSVAAKTVVRQSEQR